MRESISKSRPSTPSPITHILPFYHPPPLTYSLSAIVNHSHTPSLSNSLTYSLTIILTHILPHFHIKSLSYSLTTIPNHSITTILDHSHTPLLSYPISLSFSYHNQSLATDQQIKQHMELWVQRVMRPSTFRDF